MKLKLGIKRVGSIVFGRVLEQDEALRDEGVLADGGDVIERIEAIGCPELIDDALFVRGDDPDSDNDWFTYGYDNESGAIQAVRDIKMLVAKINGNEEATEPEDCGLEIIE